MPTCVLDHALPVCPGEKTWRQPLEDSYWEIMKSPIADMKNAGSRYACGPRTFLPLHGIVSWSIVDP